MSVDSRKEPLISIISNSKDGENKNNTDKDEIDKFSYDLNSNNDSWPVWRYVSSLPIYVLPLAAATGGYLFTESQLTNQPISLKASVASFAAMVIFFLCYIALKELRRKARQNAKEDRVKNLLLGGFILSLGIFACGLEYGLLSNNQSQLIKFGIPALTFFVGIVALMVYYVCCCHIKNEKHDSESSFNRRSRDFCCFIVFALLMGFCSAFGAYAFWNMLFGQIAGIIFGAVFLIANGFLLGRDYLSLISEKENKDKKKKDDPDILGKGFNFIGTIGVLLGFNYEIFSLFGITPQGPGFKSLNSGLKFAFICSSIISISLSLVYCYLAIHKLAKFKFLQKTDYTLLSELQDSKSIKYNGSKHKKFAWIFAGITFVAIIFNSLAFSSGAFGEIMHQQEPLIAFICIYTLFSSLPGSILLSRGYWNEAEGKYYENRKDALLKKYAGKKDSAQSNVADQISEKTLKSAKTLKEYYDKKLNIYTKRGEEDRAKIENLSIYRIINPSGKAARVNILEWFGIGLQFAGLVYLVWSPKNGFGFLKGQPLNVKIGATFFLFFFFIIASVLKFHNIYLNNKKEIEELTKTVDDLDLFLQDNKKSFSL